jgi:acyl carrier protein
LTVREQLRDFILTELKTKLTEGVLTDSYPLLEAEAIDSLAVFTIVQFLEDQFGIEVGDDDLVVENFATIDAMATMVEAKKNSTAG